VPLQILDPHCGFIEVHRLAFLDQPLLRQRDRERVRVARTSLRQRDGLIRQRREQSRRSGGIAPLWPRFHTRRH